jgi:hypothetical protein
MAMNGNRQHSRCVRKKYPCARCHGDNQYPALPLFHNTWLKYWAANSSRIKITKTAEHPFVRHDALGDEPGVRQTMPVKNGFSSGQSVNPTARLAGGIGIFGSKGYT